MTRKSSLTLLAAAIGLAASQASAADLPRKGPGLRTAGAASNYLDRMLHRRQHRRGIWRRQCGLSILEKSLRNGSGFAGGGQIGCDYQFAGGWVIGFRNMFDGTSNNRRSNNSDCRSTRRWRG